MWDSVIPKLAYPELYSFAKNKNLSLQKAIALQSQLHRIFHIPLSNEAFTQYVELQGIILNLQPSGAKDKWVYIWGTSEFSCSKAYKQLKGHREIHPVFGWLWKFFANLNTKFSFGSSYKTSSVEEKYYTEGIWSWKTTIVLSVMQV